jgi:hypothetical protein
MSNDTRQQQETQMKADLSKRLQEKVTKETEFIGKILINDKPVESKSEEC